MSYSKGSEVCSQETRNRLFDEVADLTGLPPQLIREELAVIVKKAGANPDTLTLDELREAMVTYLKEVIVESYQGASEAIDS